MKTASWRVRNLVSGLGLILFGVAVGGGVACAHLFTSVPISWNAVTIEFVGFLTLAPIGFGISFLLDLCEETDEDRRHQAELDRLVKGLREDTEYPLEDVVKPIKLRLTQR